jgi:hypothetical protein
MLLAMWLVDRFVLDRFVGLIYLPNSSAVYRTREFEFTARINQLGFRGDDVDPPPGEPRIAVLGDSFTYGWGVEQDECWPAVLAKLLEGSGRTAAVFNLGIAGGSPRNYAEVAERAIPVLHPDVVVVAVHQGDDLEQMMHEAPERTHRFLENSMRVVGKHLHRRVVVTDAWLKQAADLRDGFADEETRRFSALDPEIKDAFLAGQLNPQCISSSVKHPEYFEEPCAVESVLVQAAVEKMSAQLTRIKLAADAVHARTLVISVPSSVYTNRSGFEAHRREGFLLSESLLTSDAADRTIHAASQTAGLKFFSVTEAFRARTSDAGLYFPLDGHWTARGNRLFAEQVAPIVGESLREQ